MNLLEWCSEKRTVAEFKRVEHDHRLAIYVASYTDSEPIIRYLASEWKGRVEHVVDVYHMLALNEATPPDLLEEFITNARHYWWAASAAAKRPDLPVEGQRKAAVHPDWLVRYGLAQNPHCRREHLRMLANDPILDVRGAVVSNGRCEPTIVERFAQLPSFRYGAPDAPPIEWSFQLDRISAIAKWRCSHHMKVPADGWYPSIDPKPLPVEWRGIFAV